MDLYAGGLIKGGKMDRQTVYEYIKKKYKASPEYPWRSYPGHAVFRHEDNKKWFALTADVAGKTLGVPDTDLVNVINLKVEQPMWQVKHWACRTRIS